MLWCILETLILDYEPKHVQVYTNRIIKKISLNLNLFPVRSMQKLHSVIQAIKRVVKNRITLIIILGEQYEKFC